MKIQGITIISVKANDSITKDELTQNIIDLIYVAKTLKTRIDFKYGDVGCMITSNSNIQEVLTLLLPIKV